MRARSAAAAAAALALALSASMLAAGCGSAARTGSGTVGQKPPPAPALLATSLTTATATWAVAVMGGSAASHNNFWQLFVRPAGTSRWKLVTPPGVADNGGLVLADTGGRSLVTAFRPSQFLTFTPLSITRDGGGKWAVAGPLDAALADSPDALAASPRTQRLLAVLTNGTAKLAEPSYNHWSTLVTRRALASTAAGRRCGLTSLTAATFTASGEPMLAGSCSRQGTAGIFASQNGTWRAAGPALPAGLARQHITVLRLTRTAQGPVALLEAGTSPNASLLAAWSSPSGTASHWVLSPPVRLGDAELTSTSFGPSGSAAIILNGGHAQVVAGPGARWLPLPALPAGTATLTTGANGYSALSVQRARLTVWQLTKGSATWQQTQTIKVPIQFGSSG
jgi:hypothetical protein